MVSILVFYQIANSQHCSISNHSWQWSYYLFVLVHMLEKYSHITSIRFIMMDLKE